MTAIVKANASRHKAMSYARMLQSERELRAQIEALLARAKAADQAEKTEPEVDIPTEIARRCRCTARARSGRREQAARQGRQAQGRALQTRLRGAQGCGAGELHGPGQPDQKRAGGGFDAGYNAQTAVDDTAHIIVAAELTNNASDAGELAPILAAVQRNLGAAPQQLLADTGYKSESVFETLSTRTVTWWSRWAERARHN